MDETKVLSRTAFLKAVNKFKRELVELPELGGAVYVSELDGAGLLSFNERVNELKLKGKKKISHSTSIEMMAYLVSLSVCDENGERLFTEKDAKILARTNLIALLALSTKAMELSGMNSAAVNEVKSQLKKVRKKSSTEN